MTDSTTLISGPDDAENCFVFAHGAGAGMEHPFMQEVAEGLAKRGIQVIRFEFPYMIKRREDGKKRPPDRADKLIAAFRQELHDIDHSKKLFIGGKSMGGRMASLLAMEEPLPNIEGIICLGFPFHPPGKPEKFKADHLANIRHPTLILQGERDTMGNAIELDTFDLSATVEVQILTDGDHSFKPRKASGFTHQQHINSCIDIVAKYINGEN